MWFACLYIRFRYTSMAAVRVLAWRNERETALCPHAFSTGPWRRAAATLRRVEWPRNVRWMRAAALLPGVTSAAVAAARAGCLVSAWKILFAREFSFSRLLHSRFMLCRLLEVYVPRIQLVRTRNIRNQINATRPKRGGSASGVRALWGRPERERRTRGSVASSLLVKRWLGVGLASPPGGSSCPGGCCRATRRSWA